MQPGVCVPIAAALGLFCRGCLSRARSLPGRSISCLPRQMSRWNSRETCSPPPPQENPRVLITGNANAIFCHELIIAKDGKKGGLFHSYTNTEPVKLPLFSTTFTVQPLFCTVGRRAVTIGVKVPFSRAPFQGAERVIHFQADPLFKLN